MLQYLDMIVLILICVTSGKVVSVCLKGTVDRGFLHLNCKVDSLRANVEIYGPDKNLYGSCLGPTKLSRQHVICDRKRNITQNLYTNITTIVKKEGDKFNIYGQWICKHGTGLGNDTFNITRTISADECTFNMNSIQVVVNVICLLCGVLGYKLFIKCNEHVQRMWEEYRRRNAASSEVESSNEEIPLLSSTTTGNECCKCQMLSVCAVCDTCQDFYCEVCCNAHTKTSPSHNVCLIDHVVKSGFDVKCRKCERKEPAFVCKQCKTILCNDCTCGYCDLSGRISLATSKGNKLLRCVSVGFSSVIRLKYGIDLPNNDFKNNRVCGLCFLNDETIVVSDINNKKIHILNNRQNNEIKFLDEPRGMAHMFGNQIAITFAYKEEIKILEIKDHGGQEIQSLSLKEIGKPYSIAYNGDHFAVEIGESEDGFIAILDSYGNVKHRIYNKHREFAYFTGNTIRLALDMTKGRIFIAALSKNTVTCTDFEGRTVWKVSIPSPRGIIFLPGIPELKNLILANKRHDTVYQMSSKDGSTDVLISEGIEGPRYMAYNLHKKLLCVQIGNNKLMVYHYDIT